MDDEQIKIHDPGEEVPLGMRERQREFMQELILFYRRAMKQLSDDIGTLAKRCVNCATLGDTCPDCRVLADRCMVLMTSYHDLENQRHALNDEYAQWLQDKGEKPEGGFDA